MGVELWNKRKPRPAVTLEEAPTEIPRITPASVEEVDAASFEPTQTTKKGTEVVTNTGEPAKSRIKERSFQAKLEWRLDDDEVDSGSDHSAREETVAGQEKPEGPVGVLKWRCDQRMRMGLLYECRYKSLLFSLGTDINLKRLDAPFRTVGLAVQFSS